jgi:hypothetical protein
MRYTTSWHRPSIRVRFPGDLPPVYTVRMHGRLNFIRVVIRNLLVSSIITGLGILVMVSLLAYLSPGVVAGIFSLMLAVLLTYEEIADERAQSAQEKVHSGQRKKRPASRQKAAVSDQKAPEASAMDENAVATAAPEQRRAAVQSGPRNDEPGPAEPPTSQGVDRRVDA